MPFMALVEDHHIDPGQLLVALEPLEQHPGGHHLHHRRAPHRALPAHRETDALPDPLPE